MADDEYEMEWDEDENGWDENNEGNNEADEGDPAVMIQNNFYEGEGNLRSAPEAALANFQQVVELEDSLSKFEFSFNSIKYIIILSMQLGGDANYTTMIAKTRFLLNMANKVSRNDMTEAVNAI